MGAVRADLLDALRRAGELLRDEIEAEDDIAVSAEYKRHLASVLLRRTAVAAWEVADAP